MKLTLVNKFATKTSRGMLSKAWYKDEKEVSYLVKGNSMENRIVGYEPYSEVLAYRIGKILGIDCMAYALIPSKYAPDVHVYGSLDCVSICMDQFLNQRMSFYEYMVISGRENTNPLHFYLNSGLDLNYLAKMLAFDAFIGNRDRHLGNFDVYIKDGKFYNAPVYDNGASLLAWESSSYVKSIKHGNKIYNDKSKPFKSTHTEQVKLALWLNNNKPIFNIRDKRSFYKYVFEQCNDIFELMPKYRADAIKNYLLNRSKYLV